MARAGRLPPTVGIDPVYDRLAPLLTPELFGTIIAAVPDEWLSPQDGLPDAAAHKAAYLDYLTRRLAVHRKLAQEAERVRTGA